MVHCHDMKKGDIFYCTECGLELQVINECTECETEKGECSCNCSLMCCDHELKQK